MRIGLVSTLATRVGRVGSGSVEQLVWLLAREYGRRGHDVTVFASADSQLDVELVATVPGRYASAGAPDDWQLAEWMNLCRAVEESFRLDVLHSHAYLLGMPLAPLSRAPIVHTQHVMPFGDEALLLAQHPGACVTALSAFQWS